MVFYVHGQTISNDIINFLFYWSHPQHIHSYFLIANSITIPFHLSSCFFLHNTQLRTIVSNVDLITNLQKCLFNHSCIGQSHIGPLACLHLAHYTVILSLHPPYALLFRLWLFPGINVVKILQFILNPKEKNYI